MRAITRPQSFIYTLMGDLVHARGGEIWVGSLARLMGEFGVSEAALRQALSRMSRSGWIAARKVGNRSYYAMTSRGSERVAAISPRIYEAPAEHWDGRWRMVAYAIPEALRSGRDALRKELSVLGFAPLNAALYLSPRDALAAAHDAAEANGVLTYVNLFVAEGRGPKADGELIAACWDLAAIAAEYREFIAATEAALAEARTHPPSDAEAFVLREWLVHDFRKFVYRDPGVPLALLPPDWPGRAASALFRAYYDALTPGAQRYFDAAFEPAPDRV